MDTRKLAFLHLRVMGVAMFISASGISWAVPNNRMDFPSAYGCNPLAKEKISGFSTLNIWLL